MSNRMSRFDVAMQQAMAAEMRARVGRMNRTQAWLQKEANVKWPTWRRYFVVTDDTARPVPMDAVRRLAEALGMTTGELTGIAERDAPQYLADVIGGTEAEREGLRQALDSKDPEERNLRSSTEQKPGRSAMGE